MCKWVLAAAAVVLTGPVVWLRAEETDKPVPAAYRLEQYAGNRLVGATTYQGGFRPVSPPAAGSTVKPPPQTADGSGDQRGNAPAAGKDKPTITYGFHPAPGQPGGGTARYYLPPPASLASAPYPLAARKTGC